MVALLVFHVACLLILPIFLIGVVNRTKAVWAGRKGFPLTQLYFDLARLMRKTPVRSEVSTWVFQIAPCILFASTLLASLVLSLVPGYAPLHFPFDIIAFAYLLGLGRVFLMLSALDTGSSFEGMGASREATYSALIEPALLIGLGTLAVVSGHDSFESIFPALPQSALDWGGRLVLFVSLFILLQIETARLPVDDPNTHLELTMIHEVMVLDHSGPDLAVIQYVAAMKFTLFAGLISVLLNPFSALQSPALAVGFCLTSLVGITVLVALLESLIARFRLSAIPGYTLVALVASLFCLGIAVLGKAGTT